jgi:hypothetical protein
VSEERWVFSLLDNDSHGTGWTEESRLTPYPPEHVAHWVWEVLSNDLYQLTYVKDGVLYFWDVRDHHTRVRWKRL